MALKSKLIMNNKKHKEDVHVVIMMVKNMWTIEVKYKNYILIKTI